MTSHLFGCALTDRERQIYADLAVGLTSRQTGVHLGISHRTVEAHRKHLYEKTGARNAAELVRIMMDRENKLAGLQSAFRIPGQAS